MGEPGRAWRVIRLHHVAFAHRGSDAPRVLTGLLGLPCVHEEDAAGFTERMIPAGEAYLQLLEATGPGIIERFLAAVDQGCITLLLKCRTSTKQWPICARGACAWWMKHPGLEAWEQGSPLFTRRRVPGSCSSWSSHLLPGPPARMTRWLRGRSHGRAFTR